MVNHGVVPDLSHPSGRMQTSRTCDQQKLGGTVIQGGLDPKILLKDQSNIKKGVESYLSIFSDYPYIFNLGHGVLPSTNPEKILHLIKTIRNF